MWDLVSRLPNANIIQSLWNYRHKMKYGGSFEGYKSRLIGDGVVQ